MQTLKSKSCDTIFEINKKNIVKKAMHELSDLPMSEIASIFCSRKVKSPIKNMKEFEQLKLAFIKQILIEMPDISIGNVAILFNFDATHFGTWFKRHENISPLQYRKEQLARNFQVTSSRIEHAKKLLADHPSSLQEIAKACGYKTTRSFVTSFKQESGQTPRQYAAQFNMAVSRPFNAQCAISKGRITQAQNFLETYPLMEIQKAAEILGYPCKNSFSQAFKKYTGVSPENYVQKILQQSGFMYHARDRLTRVMLSVEKTPHASFTEIAEKCGYKSQANVNLEFNRALHINPTQYLKKYRRDAKGLEDKSWTEKNVPEDLELG